MRYWWVNQNRTYRHEVPNGFMWSPRRTKTGRRNVYWDSMTQVQPGDIVFSFAGSHIKAVGVVVRHAEECPQPELGPAGKDWHPDGWIVEVAFTELRRPVHPASHMRILSPLMPEKHAPLQASGRGQQRYLQSIPDSLAEALLHLVGPQFNAAIASTFKLEQTESRIENELAAIMGRTDIGTPIRQQLVSARRGQGIFKINVHQNEKQCRVTGVGQLHHLRASHIKPWRDSDDTEKLHGCNGLLLAPHVDHLFDRGHISFEDNGDLLVSPLLEPEVLNKWAIPIAGNVGAFNVDQRHFLEHHRKHVWKGSTSLSEASA